MVDGPVDIAQQGGLPVRGEEHRSERPRGDPAAARGDEPGPREQRREEYDELDDARDRDEPRPGERREPGDHEHREEGPRHPGGEQASTLGELLGERTHRGLERRAVVRGGDVQRLGDVPIRDRSARHRCDRRDVLHLAGIRQIQEYAEPEEAGAVPASRHRDPDAPHPASPSSHPVERRRCFMRHRARASSAVARHHATRADAIGSRTSARARGIGERSSERPRLEPLGQPRDRPRVG